MGKSHYHFIFFLCFAFSVSILYLQTRSVQLCVRFARRMLDDLVSGLSVFFL